MARTARPTSVRPTSVTGSSSGTRRSTNATGTRGGDRAAYVAKHPLCEDCEAAGRLTPVQEVHHVVPLSQGGTHDPSNLRSLCRSLVTQDNPRKTETAGAPGERSTRTKWMR